MNGVGVKKWLGVATACLVTTMLVTACTSDQPEAQSEPAQSAPQSQPQGPDVVWDEGRRESSRPLVPHDLPGVPFTVWAAEEAVDQQTVVLNAADAKPESERIVELGAAQTSEPPEVLTLLSEGSGFGVGIDEQSSLPEVGLISPEGGFTSLSALPGIAAANYLPHGVPYQTLNAFTAASSPRAVVWVAMDESTETWSLMCWNREEGTLQELASSSSMTESSGVAFARMISDPKLSTNGRYALFTAEVAQGVLDGANPGTHIEDMPLPEKDSDGQYGAALFRVAIDSPGDLMYLGQDLLAESDPVFTRGIFSVSLDPNGAAPQYINSSSEGAQSVPQEQAQSGAWSMGGQPWQTAWQSPCDGAADESCNSVPPRAVVWSDEEASEPILLVEDSQTWTVTALSASDRYLSVAVGRALSEQESVGSVESSSWLLVWDLESARLLAAIDTGRPADPDSSSRLVVWSDMTVAGGSADAGDAFQVEPPQSEEVQSGLQDGDFGVGSKVMLFEPPKDDDSKATVYSLPFDATDRGPKASDDILAIRTVDDGGVPNWTFLQWK